ncbi:hypothetical protein E3N88_38394 [Mikania micrantha]|uniref:Uncharacterized protein n=1 Tax=Mikania micrantha TaxID=192012 RepID=A0A5N6LTY1_9ASTR|nr:hypothetical protein E3N88_38394 [Mikania micrantha]
MVRGKNARVRHGSWLQGFVHVTARFGEWLGSQAAGSQEEGSRHHSSLVWLGFATLATVSVAPTVQPSHEPATSFELRLAMSSSRASRGFENHPNRMRNEEVMSNGR